ncbi:MAG TPA: NAD(P)-dependent alcohol dehydrogenase [Verrucomicrobiae bacterium]|jgi:NADPH:quinone reductase-like Zn-dependent oxidoreductase|nr:NAD(P)-dependent alcohol dehydrogenase [Verrucomicrobiae bacterium]
MRAYQLIASNGPESLKLNQLGEPQPAPGQVLVRVHATSLNYRDLMVATGRYGAHVPLPLIPLSDGAGEIVAVGAGVTRWKAGDRVAGTFFQNWQGGAMRRDAFGSALGGAINGMLAEFVALSADGVIAIPPHLSFEEAATLPCAALTAWHALVTSGNISAGQTVLVLGTGGVSIFALQFAKMHGARVIITSSSDAKLARAKALGADETINYRATPDWEKEVFRLTDKAGADHVVEVGGTDTFPKSLRALALGGTISVIGGVSGFTSEVPLGDILGKSAVIRGIYVGSHEMFSAMNRAVSLHQLKPVIDRAFPFSEAPAAYRHQESGAHFGKVVITV